MNEIFDYQNLLTIIKKCDRNMIDELNLSTYNITHLDFFGSAWLHYVAESKISVIINDVHSARKNRKKLVRGNELANIIEGPLEYKEYNTFFYHNVKLEQGQVLNSYQWLKEIRTNNGKAYFKISKTTKPLITVFTSHFFDRFAIRTGMADTPLSAAKIREQVIYKYMSSNLASNIPDKILEHDGNIAIGTEEGLCLGVKHDNMILVKTFVSNDMLKGNQPIQAEETCQPLFDQFNDILINDSKYEIDKFGTRKKKQDIGRNDPCPCGSTQKFKKCCANLPQ